MAFLGYPIDLLTAITRGQLPKADIVIETARHDQILLQIEVQTRH